VQHHDERQGRAVEAAGDEELEAAGAGCRGEAAGDKETLVLTAEVRSFVDGLLGRCRLDRRRRRTALVELDDASAATTDPGEPAIEVSL
jgi:hypothetical protein